MSDITQIRAKIETADVDGAGTSAWVYLGLAGREFLLDSGSGSDFVQGAKTCFVLGEQNTHSDPDSSFTDVTVNDAEWNDPRKPQLDTEDLDYPAYIRFVKSGDNPPWCIERVQITVHTSTGDRHHFDNRTLAHRNDARRIWLHDLYGERLFLRQV
ncbi:hypothetical protein [Streptomyces sp. NPDC088746]|uniref:hypothetical protein n=1 Tax=Streptomyces sp. NPDC088746 TaxID=3365885 RepID=UPI00380AFDF0